MNINMNPECLPESGIHADIARRATERERARCIKVLEDLRDAPGWDTADRNALRWAITALSEAATPAPVASSPVGGEQHG